MIGSLYADAKSLVKRNKRLTWLYVKTKLLIMRRLNLYTRAGNSQSDENEILNNLLLAHTNIPKTFVEFGFSGWEFNCNDLCNGNSWKGFLIDADPYNINIAQARFGNSIESKQAWITKDNIKNLVETWLGRSRSLGVLSIDVDGNDYWLLKELIHLNAAIVIMEYNSAFGHNKVSAIYDKSFDRTRKHDRWTYYGVSLSMVTHFLSDHGYTLTAISSNGVNAFYLRNDFVCHSDKTLDPIIDFKDSFTIRDLPSWENEWEYIKDLEYEWGEFKR
mgnify:CR=1 FL=1